MSFQTVELLAIRDSICFPLSYGFRSLLVENDAMLVYLSSIVSIVIEILELFNSVVSGSWQFILLEIKWLIH